MVNGTGFDDLFIVDDEYLNTAPSYQQKLKRIQEIWNDYIRISNEIVAAQGTKSDLAGSRAKAYSEFIALAQQNVGAKMEEVGAESEKDMKTYVSMIEEADNILY